MERALRPERLEINDDYTSASKIWNHWLVTFEKFLSEVNVTDTCRKLKLLTKNTSPTVYLHISECKIYKEAIYTFNKLYVKLVNEIYTRYELPTGLKIQKNLWISVYKLTLLAKGCQFKAVTADINKDDYIREAFINGLRSPNIRQ